MVFDPGDIAGSLAQGFGSSLPDLAYWSVIGVVSAAVVAGIYVYVVYNSFKYQITIFQRGGTGEKDDAHSIRKILTTRGKDINKNGMQKFGFWMKKYTMDPVPMKYIYPGNKIFLYQVGLDQFIPIKFSCANPEAFFNPLPHSIRRWQILEIQEAYRDYKEDSFMSKYGGALFALLAIIGSLVFVGVVIWMNYKYVGQGLGDAAAAANNMATSFREGMAQKFTGG